MPESEYPKGLPTNSPIRFTKDDEFITGEVYPKIHGVALKHIKSARGRGMPQNLDGYDIGVTVTINGRHVSNAGATIGVMNGVKLSRDEVHAIALDIMATLAKHTKGMRFSHEDEFKLYGRDLV